jgi:hypothetical protein
MVTYSEIDEVPCKAFFDSLETLFSSRHHFYFVPHLACCIKFLAHFKTRNLVEAITK